MNVEGDMSFLSTNLINDFAFSGIVTALSRINTNLPESPTEQNPNVGLAVGTPIIML
jgi:hypothetical protein